MIEVVLAKGATPERISEVAKLKGGKGGSPSPRSCALCVTLRRVRGPLQLKGHPFTLVRTPSLRHSS